MIKKAGLLLVLGMILAGCGGGNPEAGQDNTGDNIQPINYEDNQEEQERLGIKEESLGERGGYPQTNMNEMNTGDEDAQSDIYTNEVSVSIANHLKQRREIVQAQVGILDDRIVVGVMLDENVAANMKDIVKREVESMMPNKEVVVFTEDIYWDHMSNHDASPDEHSEMHEFLREFFGRE
ncbi:YhcN/YlaJ family sporulation lipoprotein [Virgibacillus kekensis]|uniref:YhcN/YlaJ family sporulation lipoprotein n=1 Tax=Virgibacillus kekensis TaxID=202261 RepID=A0ABV9DJE2_9BACI